MNQPENKASGLIVFVIVSITAFFVVAVSIASEKFLYNSLLALDAAATVALTPSAPAARVLLFFTYLANVQVVIALLVVLAIFLLIAKRQAIAIYFITGFAAGGALSTLFKFSLGRQRPFQDVFDLPRHGFAFPSGHAIIATVVYGFAGYCLMRIARKPWQKWFIALSTSILIIIIGISRIALGFHWVSDVIGGWLLGAALLGLLITVYEHVHMRERWKKMAMPHGMRLVTILILIGVAGFMLFGFYVTHPLKVRSIIEYQYQLIV